MSKIAKEFGLSITLSHPSNKYTEQELHDMLAEFCKSKGLKAKGNINELTVDKKMVATLEMHASSDAMSNFKDIKDAEEKTVANLWRVFERAGIRSQDAKLIAEYKPVIKE